MKLPERHRTEVKFEVIKRGDGTFYPAMVDYWYVGDKLIGNSEIRSKFYWKFDYCRDPEIAKKELIRMKGEYDREQLRNKKETTFTL